jgi:hypothetical protein
MNEAVLKAFLIPHIVAGSIALVTFWTSAYARKGGTLHRYSGRVYLIAMLGILITGVPLTLLNWARGNPVGAAFLGYLLVLVSYSCLAAWRAIRHKRDFQRYSNAVLKISAGLLAMTGIAVIALGVSKGAVILIAFGAIGPITAWQAFALIRRGPVDGRWWLREHFGAVVGNGIATHIAFLGIGLSRLLQGIDLGIIQMLTWLGPLSIGLFAAYLLNKKYAPVKKAQAS